MKNIIKGILPVLAAIVIAGLVLDEAGKGTFGDTVKGLAGKVTSGFGQ